MFFNSIPFLIFLAIVTLLYNIVAKKYRICLLLIAGYVFYAFNGILYLLFLLLVTAISYCGAILIHKAVTKRTVVLGVFLVSVLSFLLYFKYTSFGILLYNDISALWGGPPVDLYRLIIPVGISFYTFVALGYLIDVYRRDAVPERNLMVYALFVSYFPAILSGPIERSKRLLPQLKSLERTRYENAREALILFLWGVFYKIVLADRLALCANCVFSDIHSYRGISLLAASLAFTFQIYFDFAGYTYMAIGVSNFFNIKLNTNFNKPYLAVSLTDFWRRWHISLTSWFRDYLYIPLGGNRVSQGRWIFNILVVFLVSGLWHGAYYTFIIWGGLHAVAQIIEKYVIHDKNYRTGVFRGNSILVRVGRVIFTFCIVSSAWVFFKASSVHDAVALLKGICTFTDYSLTELFAFKGTYLLFGMSIIDTILAVSLVIVTTMLEIFVGNDNDGCAIPSRILKLGPLARWTCYLILTFLVLWFGKFGATEFVYFNF